MRENLGMETILCSRKNIDLQDYPMFSNRLSCITVVCNLCLIPQYYVEGVSILCISILLTLEM